MKHTLKKLTLFLVLVALLNITTTGKTVYGVDRLEIAYQNGGVVERIFLQSGDSEDLRFFGAPNNWASLHPTWYSFDETIATVDGCGVVTAENAGNTAVLLRLDNGMIGLVYVYVTDKVPQETEKSTEDINAETPDKAVEEIIKPVTTPEVDDKEPAKEEKKETEEVVKVILNNQEKIHIPASATFVDGTPIGNMCDIAKYAFSYVTTVGDSIVPTYETDKYGIAEIADVDYSTIKGARTVIVKNVYFKVYLDFNKDGVVSVEEKTTGAVGYYYIKVNVDRTLTVEDWNMVQ